MIILFKYVAGNIKLYVLEILYKIKLWSPSFENDYKEAINNFKNINNYYWKDFRNKQPYKILVEGHLSDYGINYLFRTATCALAIQEKIKNGITVLYPGLSHNWVLSQKAYESFNITNFCFLGNYPLSNIYFLFLAKWKILDFKKKIKKPEDIIKIKFNGIIVGDLIYDDVIKLNNLITIDEIDFKVINSISRSYYYFLQYNYFFSKNQFKYFISTHSAYSEYGLLVRVALKKNIKVIETTDIQTNYFTNISDNELPTYHQGIYNLIQNKIKKSNGISKNEILESKLKLNERMNSLVNQIDVQKAYKGIEYSRNLLIEKLKLEENNKIVFILAHVFKDSPHTSSWMLHKDYYTWLTQTIKICSKIEDVNWVVKPHPSANLYNEDGVIDEMIKALNVNNVLYCPKDLNTKSLVNCADAIVTVHGTAGLEFACFGIPVLIAGKPFYAGFNFTLEPKTTIEYENELRNLNKINKLNAIQIKSALKVLHIWNTQFDWNNKIITPKILSYVWGSEVTRNPLIAYYEIIKNIKAENPRKLKMWELTQYYISND